MHANYWQFLAYNKGPNKIDFENIILITTGDDMSKQHLDELKASGIPATLFQGENGGYFEADKNIVKVISIHKLKLHEDKKGEGVTIDVESLGTKNLVFVDEGHKGQKSEDMKWKRTREYLAKDGFTFEYSATFGQAIDSSNEESFREYSKAILFDYSYKYFYGDGYGKDFRILNLGKKEFNDTQTKTLLLANAIAFYEQLIQYRNLGQNLKEYNMEKPLWIFVGSKVQKEASDVFKVVQFLNWFLNTNQTEILQRIDSILKGHSGILADNKDVFAQRHPERNFAYFRENKTSAQDIYDGILKDIFYVSPQSTGHKLCLKDLKDAEGEIGLRAGTDEKYFAVINIGDKREFLKLVEDSVKDISIQKDALGKSLFEDINEVTSPVNLLIGSKKFVEGWNSWRVSTMSLLYIGKGAGPQIIQLFGRGVRLKGKNLCLKRSQPPRPSYIEILETMHIFGIQANYLENFQQIIDKEEVLNSETTIPVKNMEFPDDLQTLGLKEGWTFEQELLKLEQTDNPKDPTYELGITLDLIPRALVLDSRGDRTLTATTPQTPQVIRKEILDILDWDDIYYRILEYKNERGLFNIAIAKEYLKQIIYNKKYTLLCDPEFVEPKTFQALEQTTDIVLLILKKHLNIYYSKKRNAAEKKHIQLHNLKQLQNQKSDIIIRDYIIKFKDQDQVLIEKIKEFVDSGKIYNSTERLMLAGDLNSFITDQPIIFQNALFKGHIYQPLLVKQDNSKVATVPTGLNEGESRFIEDLRNYLDEHPPTYQVYLLRNPPKGGVGFYENHSFYPDFILWIKDANKQSIVFIDPKGLARMSIDDQKLKLHNFLKDELEKEIGNPNVKLDAFVISVTAFNDFANNQQHPVTMEKLEHDKHILFQLLNSNIPNKGYIERMFEIIGV